MICIKFSCWMKGCILHTARVSIIEALRPAWCFSGVAAKQTRPWQLPTDQNCSHQSVVVPWRCWFLGGQRVNGSFGLVPYFFSHKMKVYIYIYVKIYVNNLNTCWLSRNLGFAQLLRWGIPCHVLLGYFGTRMVKVSPYVGNVIIPTDELHHFLEG